MYFFQISAVRKSVYAYHDRSSQLISLSGFHDCEKLLINACIHEL